MAFPMPKHMSCIKRIFNVWMIFGKVNSIPFSHGMKHKINSKSPMWTMRIDAHLPPKMKTSIEKKERKKKEKV